MTQTKTTYRSLVGSRCESRSVMAERALGQYCKATFHIAYTARKKKDEGCCSFHLLLLPGFQVMFRLCLFPSVKSDWNHVSRHREFCPLDFIKLTSKLTIPSSLLSTHTQTNQFSMVTFSSESPNSHVCLTVKNALNGCLKAL